MTDSNLIFLDVYEDFAGYLLFMSSFIYLSLLIFHLMLIPGDQYF